MLPGDIDAHIWQYAWSLTKKDPSNSGHCLFRSLPLHLLNIPPPTSILPQTDRGCQVRLCFFGVLPAVRSDMVPHHPLPPPPPRPRSLSPKGLSNGLARRGAACIIMLDAIHTTTATRLGAYTRQVYVHSLKGGGLPRSEESRTLKGCCESGPSAPSPPLIFAGEGGNSGWFRV